MALVLLVDDDDDVRLLLRLTFEMAGHTVIDARSGEEAVRVAGERMPACVVLDIGLPDVDGYEVVRRVRHADPERRIRLVALTGHGGPEHRARATAVGLDAHLLKPVEPRTLLATVAALLE